MSKKKRTLLLLDAAMLVLLVILDQFTKHLAVIHLKDQAAIPLIQDVFELSYLENRGAAFGVLQNQKMLFLIISVIIFAAAVYVLFKAPDDRKYNLLHVFLVMVASGDMGNMIDRIRFEYVVDFFSFVLIHFPVFNVADIYVTVSMLGLAVLVLFIYKDEDFQFLSLKKQD